MKILTFSSETMRGICCSLISAWEQRTDDGYHKIILTTLVRCRQKRSHIFTHTKNKPLWSNLDGEDPTKKYFWVGSYLKGGAL